MVPAASEEVSQVEARAPAVEDETLTQAGPSAVPRCSGGDPVFEAFKQRINGNWAFAQSLPQSYEQKEACYTWLFLNGVENDEDFTTQWFDDEMPPNMSGVYAKG